jgi:phage terminase large subunit
MTMMLTTLPATKRVKSVSGFTFTRAIRRLRKLKKRIKVVPGGTSAGKTFGILPIMIDRATKTPLLEISVVSESIPHLRKGALKDFLKIMKATGRYIDKNYNRTLLTYTFSNGSYIEFFSADQEDKVRGPRRNILYINECNNISFETYHQLAIRTSHEVWLDFNPSNEFWAYTELKDDEDAEWLTLTYKDNEALPESIIKEIEKAKKKAYYDPGGDINDPKNKKSLYWDNWWKVYGLGLLGALEGVIFTNWKKIKEIPAGARFIGSGLDFGFTNDPTGIVDIYEWEGKRILDERCYRTGLLNAQICEYLDKDSKTYADSADPKSIAELNVLGYKKVEGADKGPDSIVYGIQIMQGQEYLVTEQSTNLIKELRSYCWDKDKKTGKALNKPIDHFNHLIDAIRYHEMMTISKTKGWTRTM